MVVPAVPHTLAGSYELLERIGEGGMGKVFRAWDSRLERAVAIKMASGLDAVAAERLEREARSLARISHPSLVTLFDIGRDDSGHPFLVMELLEGETLTRYVEVRGHLAEVEAVELVLPVLDGLSLCHDAGLVHRDIKPDNLIVVRDSAGRPQLKLVDFGIARRTDLASDLTVGILGTPDYMAPEQLSVGGPVGPATDVWSCCVCLYAMATGRLPFGGNGLGEIFHAIARAPLPYPRDVHMDGKLFAILAHGTRKDPADRPPSVRSLRLALEGWLALERPQSAPRTVGTAQATIRSELSSTLGAEAAAPSDAPVSAPAEPSESGSRAVGRLDELIRRSLRGTK